MWQQIKLLYPYSHPNQMIMDFEKAAINSFEQVWPDTFVKCCFFHLTQNVFARYSLMDCNQTTTKMKSCNTHPPVASPRARRTPRGTPSIWRCCTTTSHAPCNQFGFIFRKHLYRASTSRRHLPGGAVL